MAATEEGGWAAFPPMNKKPHLPADFFLRKRKNLGFAETKRGGRIFPWQAIGGEPESHDFGKIC